MKHSHLKPFHKTNAVFWRALIGALICLGVYVYLFYIVRISGEHAAALQAETQVLLSQESEVGQLKQSLAATQEQQKTLTSYFIDASNIVPFLETVEGYGKTTNVTTSFDTVDTKKSPDRLDVALTADGSFADLYRFLSLLESAPYEFTITKADIHLAVPLGFQAVGKGPHSSGWEAKIALSVTSITGVQ